MTLGLTHRDTAFNFMEQGEAAISVPVPHAEAPIRRTKGIATGELAFLKKVVALLEKILTPDATVRHNVLLPVLGRPGRSPRS